MARGKIWERKEQMLALELYCRTPFGRISQRNTEIIDLSEKLGRTPSSVSLKMANFSALDPTVQQKGMGNYSKSDAIIWEEFFNNPSAFLDNVAIFAARLKNSVDVDREFPPDLDRNALEFHEGKDVPVVTTRRKHQDFFRKTLLTAYNGKCGVTQINQPELLIASHIIPWSKDERNRLNPRNGILLNALHDRAFDNGLISFEDNLDIMISPRLKLHEMARPFFQEKKLTPPEKFGPNPTFLAHHRDHCFQDSI